MIKPYHLLFCLVAGFAVGAIAMTCGGKGEIISHTPEILKLRADNEWRKFKEIKLKDTIKNIRVDLVNLAKGKIIADQKATKAEARYASIRWRIPKDQEEQITFLKEDTVACDSVIIAYKAVTAVISKELTKTQKEVAQLDSLVSNLEADKKNLEEVDSLKTQDFQIEKKELVKKGRKKFMRGLGIGGAIIAVLVVIF